MALRQIGEGYSRSINVYILKAFAVRRTVLAIRF